VPLQASKPVTPVVMTKVWIRPSGAAAQKKH